jgi:hypothetical protein
VEEIISMWIMIILIFSGGVWYIKEGYYYGFVKQKFKKSKFHIGDDSDDYLYGKSAKKMGTFQILGGIMMIIIALWSLIDELVL